MQQRAPKLPNSLNTYNSRFGINLESIWFLRLLHTFDTICIKLYYKFKGKIDIQKGDTLGIIMDHAATEANHTKIKELFANCRQVLIESFYKHEDQELAVLNYHSYTTESAKVMNAAKVKEAIPVHFSRKYNEEEVQELIKEFEKARSNQ